MKMVFASLVVASALSHGAPAGANLLSNPGAEAGSLAGWVPGGDSSPRTDSGGFNAGIDPYSGSFDFLGGTGSAGTLTQTVPIKGIVDAQIANVSFWEQGLDQGAVSDNGFVRLAFLDFYGDTIATVSSPVVDSHDLTWQRYTGSFAIPSGTASIGYTMHFTRHVGSDLDAYFDDNELTVTSGVPVMPSVPEPSSLALMAIGLLGCASRAAELAQRQGSRSQTSLRRMNHGVHGAS